MGCPDQSPRRVAPSVQTTTTATATTRLAPDSIYRRGRLRYLASRLQSGLRACLFRARLPMAYSSGFNPHPRISYAGAAPTGTASEAEYLEIALAQVCDPDLVAQDIDQALPVGLDVVRVVEAGKVPG
ncbi:MAG: TIGR03936 family radical SAM-associated protein [Nocardioidaceae bacterium]|nr:TIGR03936 family radical SAM-associated protein [Nocardioidaceae bacterium]